MKSTFKILFYLKRNAIRKDGRMPIITRVTVDSIIGQFNTKLEILPNNWSVKLGKVIGQSSDSKQYNAQLNEIKASLHGISGCGKIIAFKPLTFKLKVEDLWSL